MTIDRFEIFVVKPKTVETINLIKNPSFEKATTGWTAVSTTLNRYGYGARFGIYCLNVTLTSTTTAGVYYGNVSLVSGKTYTFSVYGKFENGVPFRMYFADTSGNVLGTPVTFTGDGQDRRYSVTYANLSTADRRLYIAKNSSSSVGEFNIDGAMCVEETSPSTYFDGDTEGFLSLKGLEYYWNLEPHNSESVRTAVTRSGGDLIPISNYCKRIGIIGLGMSPVQNLSIPLVTGGSRYLYTKKKSRYFTIQIAFDELTVGEIDQNREEIRKLLDANYLDYPQPIILRWVGYNSNGIVSTNEVDIKCHYVDGLQRNPQTNKPYVLDLTFEMLEPMMELSTDESILNNNTYTVSNANYAIKRDIFNVWKAIGGTAFDGAVYVIAQNPNNGHLIFGGAFTSANGVANTRNICGFDGANYYALSTGAQGTSSYVKAISFDKNGLMYVGGYFDTLGSVANTRAFGSWNGSVWSAIGGGLTTTSTNVVYDICIDSANNVWVAGNLFNATYGINNFALWNGSAWSSPCDPDDIVYCACLDNQENIILGGWFDAIGGSAHYAVAKYNKVTSSVEAMGTGMTGLIGTLPVITTVYDLVKYTNGDIYAVGNFLYADGKTANGIAYWNGFEWMTVANGFNAGGTGYTCPTDIHLDNKGGIIIGGYFTSVNSIPLPNKVVRLKNGVFQLLDVLLPSSGKVEYSFTDRDNNLYLGYTTSGSATRTDIYGGLKSKAKAYPIFVIHGGGQLVQAGNYDNNTFVQFNNLVLGTAETVTIDCRPNKLTVVSDMRGDLRSYIINGSNMNIYIGENKSASRVGAFIVNADGNTLINVRFKRLINSLDMAQL